MPHWKEQFDKAFRDKIVSHLFDGSCCYNENEGGKGHKECRYPYNPNRENPIGEQCLRLEKEHLDIKSFITEQLSALARELGKLREEKYCMNGCGNMKCKHCFSEIRAKHSEILSKWGLE